MRAVISINFRAAAKDFSRRASAGLSTRLDGVRQERPEAIEEES
jgi:hypothetical protein